MRQPKVKFKKLTTNTYPEFLKCEFLKVVWVSGNPEKIQNILFKLKTILINTTKVIKLYIYT